MSAPTINGQTNKTLGLRWIEFKTNTQMKTQQDWTMYIDDNGSKVDDTRVMDVTR